MTSRTCSSWSALFGLVLTVLTVLVPRVLTVLRVQRAGSVGIGAVQRLQPAQIRDHGAAAQGVHPFCKVR